jgi:hypothetical protein
MWSVRGLSCGSRHKISNLVGAHLFRVFDSGYTSSSRTDVLGLLNEPVGPEAGRVQRKYGLIAVY